MQRLGPGDHHENPSFFAYQIGADELNICVTHSRADTHLRLGSSRLLSSRIMGESPGEMYALATVLTFLALMAVASRLYARQIKKQLFE